MSRRSYKVCPVCLRSDGDYWVYPEGWERKFEGPPLSVELDALIDELAERRKGEHGTRGDGDDAGGVGDAF